MATKKTKLKRFKPTRWFSPLRALNFALLLALVGAFYLIFGSASPIAGLYGSVENDQVAKINAERTSHGLNSLPHIECLNTVSENWAKAMAAKGGISHNPNMGNDIRTQCGNQWQAIGENVGVGSDSSSLWNAFLASPCHKANLDSQAFVYPPCSITGGYGSRSYTAVGVGAYLQSDGRLYVVQEFVNCPGCSGTWTTPASVPTDPVVSTTNLGPFGAVINHPDGRIHIFIRGVDNQPYVAAQKTVTNANNWTPFYPMGGVISSNIAAVNNADGRIQLFARGTDNKLFTNAQTCASCGFGGWVTLNQLITSDPTPILGNDGRIRVFARGSGNSGYVMAQNVANNTTSWTSFFNLGGNLTSDITATKNKDGRIQLFARGSDDAAYTNYGNADNTFSHGWQSLGGKITSNITAANFIDGRIHIFARGTDNQPYVAAQYTASNSTSWTPFYPMGGVISSNIAAVNNADGRIVLFARGTDGSLFANGQINNGKFGGWVPLGGLLTSDPVAARLPDGRIQVFVRGSTTSVFVMTQTVSNGSFPPGSFMNLGSSLSPVSALNVIAGQH